ncbi:hypothetical protein COCON_G00157370 [Conger conger]|uniref:Uncharacterized protein n=1 Tax=Conger conger TaxID=82655 RepID=A0A9Q1D9M0_CONCO|nr:hypothetical protein COCON_G00157370 [Conger conger]
MGEGLTDHRHLPTLPILEFDFRSWLVERHDCSTRREGHPPRPRFLSALCDDITARLPQKPGPQCKRLTSEQLLIKRWRLR